MVTRRYSQIDYSQSSKTYNVIMAAPSAALVPYEPPLASAALVLKAPTRSFALKNGGALTIRQHYGAGGSKTGGAVWDASFVLADYVVRVCHQHWRPGSRTLELGAGLGLVSLAAARCNLGQVLATDGDAAVLPLLEDNVRLNGADNVTSVRLLDWADEASLEALVPAGSPPPDVILASDIIFLGSPWRALLRLVETLCRRRRAWQRGGGVGGGSVGGGSVGEEGDAAADPLVLFAQTHRIAREVEHFERLARRHAFSLRQLPAEALHPDYRRGGRLSIFALTWGGLRLAAAGDPKMVHRTEPRAERGGGAEPERPDAGGGAEPEEELARQGCEGAEEEEEEDAATEGGTM